MGAHKTRRSGDQTLQVEWDHHGRRQADHPQRVLILVRFRWQVSQAGKTQPSGQPGS